jgi:hypothetical protein
MSVFLTGIWHQQIQNNFLLLNSAFLLIANVSLPNCYFWKFAFQGFTIKFVLTVNQRHWKVCFSLLHCKEISGFEEWTSVYSVWLKQRQVFLHSMFGLISLSFPKLISFLTTHQTETFRVFLNSGFPQRENSLPRIWMVGDHHMVSVMTMERKRSLKYPMMIRPV